MRHVVIALFVQALIAYLTDALFFSSWRLDPWWVGAALAAGYFIGREFAQAEYRLIAAVYKGKRDLMPLWGGFDRRAWTAKGLIDWIAPSVAVCAVAWWM